MLLVSRDRQYIKLALTGHETPESIGPDWSLNWLLVYFEVKTVHGTGSMLDPCLTMGEADELIEWLRLVASARHVDEKDSTIYFMEPNPHFILMSQSANRIVLRVRYALESKRRWVASDGGEPQWGGDVDLDLAREDVTRAARHLADEFRRLQVPPRWR